MTNPMMLAPGQSLQRIRRALRVYTDQHGRQMEAQADIATSQPIGEFRPLGCNPPWLPPMRYAKFRADGELTFRWAYEELAAEWSGITAQYYEDAIKFALEHNKPQPEIGGPVDRSIRYVLGKPPLSPAIPLAAMAGDPWILGITGATVNQPLKDILEQGAGANSKEALEYIRAMVGRSTADRDLVPTIPAPVEKVERARSITDAAPEKPLEAMPEITYQQFVKECRGRKMSLVDISAAWKAHKAEWAENASVATGAAA